MEFANRKKKKTSVALYTANIDLANLYPLEITQPESPQLDGIVPLNKHSWKD